MRAGAALTLANLYSEDDRAALRAKLEQLTNEQQATALELQELKKGRIDMEEARK